MSGTTTSLYNQPQLNNLLGLPMGLGPTPSYGALQQNTAGIDPNALGQLYRAVNQYTLQGTDPGIQHSLLGGAASLYPSWSPMHQLANIQAQNIAGSDAATQLAALLAQAQPPQVPMAPGQDVHGGSEGSK